jgi:accessory colonization factor AcfC
VEVDGAGFESILEDGVGVVVEDGVGVVDDGIVGGGVEVGLE